MLAGSPFLPSPASALAEAIESTATETGLRAKPLLWHRDPLEQTLSAYAYHLAASEPWCSEIPSDLVAKLLDECGVDGASTVTSATTTSLPTPDEGACAAVRGLDVERDGTSYAEILNLLSAEDGALVTAWYLHSGQLTMLNERALVDGMPAGSAAIADLDELMVDCAAGFEKLWSAIGVPAGAAREACVALGCDKIKEGATSNHATSSDTSPKGGAAVAAVKEGLHELLVTAPWFAEHVHPLRVAMGFATDEAPATRRRLSAGQRRAAELMA